MAGGKGGSQTSSVEIPEYIEAAAQRNLNKAERISQLGYVPYYGPDVAALTPMQQAAMQNVAGSAGAFGLAAPTGQDIYGMPAPTEYAGGVQGYSSAPMFEQAQTMLGEKRPAQKSYIDSFFIDPFTGAYGAGAQPAVDYTQLGTVADIRDANRQNDLAIAQATANQNQAGSALTTNEYNTYVTTIQDAIGDPTYNPATDVLTPEQQILIQGNPEAQIAQDTIYMNQLGNANNTIGDAFTTLTGGEPSFDSPSGSDSYGGSLVTGELSTDLLGIPGLVGEVADNIYQKVDFEGAVEKQGENFAEMAGSELQDDGTYDISSWFTDTSATPTIDTSSFQTTYDDSTYNDQVAPMPMTYGDDSFVNAVTAAGDDLSAFLPPTVSSNSGATSDPSMSGGSTTDRLYEAQREKEAMQEQAALDAEGANQAIATGAAEATGNFIVQRYDEDTPQIFTDQAKAEEYARAFGTTAVPETTAPMTYGDDSFVNAVTAADDDVSAFLPPTGSSNDNDPVPTTSSGATVIPTGTTIATGTVLNSASDPVVNVDGVLYNQSNAPASSNNDSGNDDDGGGGGGGGGCVVATHAVSSGAFTPSMKREAVVWCMHNLHDKWWGEAIRRGYRHLGRKKIEQGKAHEHYQEFRNYIDFASGKKRTIKGAIHFAARTVQFFAVGLVKGDA